MKTSDRLFGIDSNVILRYLLGNHQVLSPKAKTVMDQMEDGRLAVMCDPVTLAEVVWVLKSHYGMDPEMICIKVKPLIEARGFLMPDKRMYVRALELYGSVIPHFGDACACASAIEKCEGRVFSFDRDLSKVHGVTRLEETKASPADSQ